MENTNTALVGKILSVAFICMTALSAFQYVYATYVLILVLTFITFFSGISFAFLLNGRMESIQHFDMKTNVLWGIILSLANVNIYLGGFHFLAGVFTLPIFVQVAFTILTKKETNEE